MSRSNRATLGEQTVRILEEGCYVRPEGHTVALAPDIKRCVEGTRLFTPEELAALMAAQSVSQAPQGNVPCVIEVENETTLAGIRRLLADESSPVAALNFASARHPGGGFLGGAQAQEESLARASGLYVSLLAATAYYERHRSSSSLLYSDSLIVSPHCPVFRDDEGTLLPQPHHVTFISGAAPNAGVLRNQRSAEQEQIPAVLRRRIGYVLALAAAEGYRQLVLGAWGCGVFKNDPQFVAQTFMELLRGEGWDRRFSRILFAVLDRPEGSTIGAFRAAVKTVQP